MLKKLSHSRDNSADRGSGAARTHQRQSSLGRNPPISGYNASPSHRRNSSRGSASSANSNFLAEQYDRDRTAIINSCFQKYDPQTGVPLNAYITHVRIIEDSRFPSSRPAMNSPLENKKKRVLIISSQSNGNGMQLHKARESSNGAFQIGRTWNLSELEMIERDVEVPQGFVVRMGKKYYWETNSAKERTVFIKSLVSTFMENSGGRVPRLVNWDLSMFYLDDNSYQRAVSAGPGDRKEPNSVTRPELVPAPLPAPLPTAASSAGLASPKRPSISSQPYSQPSPSVNDAERQLQYDNIVKEQPQSRPQSQVLTPSADEIIYDEETQNVVENINDMLLTPIQTVDIQHRRSSYHDVEELLENDSEDDPMKDFRESTSARNEEVDNPLEESVEDVDPYENEETTELSFEKDDEKRFSGDYQRGEREVTTEYHHVNTIPEEQSEITETSRADILGQDIMLEESRPRSPTGKLEETIDEQILLEVLTEVNWDTNDDSSSLLEKLHSRLADIDYGFNRSLLLLPNSLKELNPYKDRVFQECDKLDPTLSLFTMELSSVSNDVEFVESQDNGLQVRIANRKLLWKELNKILNSVSIDEQSLRELLRLPISNTSIERMETLLVELYAALKAIDGSKDQFVQDSEDDLSNMRALSERRYAYEKVTELFIERIVEQLSQKFKKIEKSTENTREALSNTLMFSSLTLFCKDVSAKSYDQLLDLWNDCVYKLYERKVDMLVSKSRPVATSQNSQHSQLSFNQTEEESLYQWWYSVKIQKRHLNENVELNTQLVSVIKSIQEMGSVCVTYQNFISCFFHLSSRVNFNEYITNVPPKERGLVDLEKVGTMESVRTHASNVNEMVSKVLQNQLVKFFNSVYSTAASNRIDNPALLLYLEYRIKELQSSNQEVFRDYLTKAYQRIQQDWRSYVDDQCVYIERAVINCKSRSLYQSVVGLPIFTRSVENSLKAICEWLSIDSFDGYNSKLLAEEAYLKVGESAVKLLYTTANSSDNSDVVEKLGSEEKLDEAVTILINTNMLLETIPLFDLDVFVPILQDIKRLFDKEKEAYSEMLLNSNMRNLITFVHGAYSLIEASGENSHVDPKQWAAYSEQNLSKILSLYTANEITVLVDKLYDNMDAHFTAENNLKSRELLCQKLWSNIQGKTVSLYLMLYSLIDKHYKNTSIKFSKNDIIKAFDNHK